MDIREIKKFPFGIVAMNIGGDWFIEQRTLSRIIELGVFDELYKARRFIEEYILQGKAV